MPLSSNALTKSLDPIKAILIDLQKRINEQDQIYQLAGFSAEKRQYERCSAWAFSEPEYYYYLRNEFHTPIPHSPAESELALPYYNEWLSKRDEDAYLNEIKAYAIDPPQERYSKGK